MRTLYGYVFRELLPPTALGLALFTFILLMNWLLRAADLLIGQGIGLLDVGKFFVYSIPHIVVMSVPMAVLLGALIGFGRLSSDSEIVAMRSGGVSVASLAVPLLLLATGGWLVNTYLATVAMPWGNNQIRQFFWRHANTQTITEEIEPRVFQDEFPGYMVRIDDITEAGELWLGVFIAETDNVGDDPMVVVAERARPHFDEEAKSFWLTLENGHVYGGGDESGELRVQRFAQNVIELVNERDLIPEGYIAKDELSMTLAELRREIAGLESGEIRPRAGPEERRLEIAQARVEVHKKFAFPLACVVLGLLALPLGISKDRRTGSTGFVLAIGVIVVYYLFVENGEKFAEEGVFPAWLGVWSANLVLGPLAVALIWVKSREIEFGIADRLAAWLASGRDTVLALRERVAGATRRDGGAGAQGGGFPRILDRHVLGQFGKIFLLAQGGLTTVWVLVEYFEISDDVYAAGADASVTLAYFKFQLPFIVHMTLPIVLLVTILTVFSLMSRSNEVVAVLSGGVSLYRLALPMLIPAIVLTTGDYLLQEYVLPHTNRQVSEIKDALYPDRGQAGPAITLGGEWAYAEGRAGRQVLQFADFDEAEQRFSGLTIYRLAADGSRLERKTYAARVVWEEDRWMAHDGSRILYRAPSPETSGAVRSMETFTVLPLAIDQPPSYFTGSAALPDEMTAAALAQHVEFLEARGFDATRYRVELHRKFAYPAILLVMALVAVPFGFRMGKQGTLSGIGVAIALAVTFWIGFVFFTALGKAGILPAPLAAWAMHVVFLSLGGYLMLELDS